MEQNFSLYLIKLGLFDEKTSNELFKSKNSFKDKTFTDISFYYLMNFFDNLTQNQKKYMSYCIPTNYKTNIAKIRKRKLKSIFIQLLLRQKLLLLKFLNIWKRNIYLYDNSLYNDKLTKILQASQNTISLDDYLVKDKYNIKNNYNYNKNSKEKLSNINDIYNNLNIKAYKSKNERALNKINKIKNKKLKENKMKNEIDDYKTFKSKKTNYNYIYHNLYQPHLSKQEKNKLLTSLESKELEDLKECTFKPRINKSLSKNKVQSQSNEKDKDNLQLIFDKLFHDEEKYKLSKELKTIDRDNTLGKNYSFTPNIKNKFKKIYKYNDHNNFIERQKDYMEKINKKREDLNNELNTKYELLCSFSPKITNEKGEYYRIRKNKELNKTLKSPVFKRLYKDNIKRKNIKEQKELENINKFNEMANFLTVDKKVNESTVIERLYENNKDDIINRAKEKVEKEEGITFQPEIEENEFMNNIEGSFLERNQKWIENRKNFIEQENERYIENLRNGGNNNKKYTAEEREQIINNIIERLYKVKNNKKNESGNEGDEEDEGTKENNNDGENEGEEEEE